MSDTVDDELTTMLRASMPFMETLGATAISASPDEVRVRLAWDRSLCTAGDLLHGGALMALADGAGGWCASMNVPEGAGTATVESKTNFFRPLTSGSVDAVTRVLHSGRRFIVVDTELRDGDERLIARVTQTQAVLTA